MQQKKSEKKLVSIMKRFDVSHKVCVKNTTNGEIVFFIFVFSDSQMVVNILLCSILQSLKTTIFIC